MPQNGAQWAIRIVVVTLQVFWVNVYWIIIIYHNSPPWNKAILGWFLTPSARCNFQPGGTEYLLLPHWNGWMDENINVHVYLYIYIYTCARVCVCVHILQWIPTLDGQSTIIQLPSSDQTWLSGQSALNGHSNGKIIQLNSWCFIAIYQRVAKAAAGKEPVPKKAWKFKGQYYMYIS